DPVWTGGITEAVKIAAPADTHHPPVTPPDFTGPGNVFAALHPCAPAPNGMVQEAGRGLHEGGELGLLTQPLPIRDCPAIPDLGPGLGAALRPEVLSRPDVHRRLSDASTHSSSPPPRR